MKEWVLNKLVNYVKKYKNITEEEEEIMLYGFESVYILIGKVIIIFLLAAFLGIFKEMLIFLILFSIVRAFAFGLHATKSGICIIVSSICFLGIPYLLTKIELSIIIKIIIGLISIGLIYKNSPADTYKRPIVDPTRRRNLKLTSTIISIVYVILSFFCNNFINNCLLFSIILECIFISPITYKLFKLPYNNYIKFLEEEDENAFC